MRYLGVVLLFIAPALLCQSNTGELRLSVTDSAGGALRVSVRLSSEANQYSTTLATDEQGNLNVRRLPYGNYVVSVQQPNMTPVAESIAIRSSLPISYCIQLSLATVRQSVAVNTAGTLLDTEQAGSVTQVGTSDIEHRTGSIPGRSLQDLINAQPGWLYEGNAVLHPRGSEYQTQFVVDGVPLTDNRSPSFGPEIEADDVESLSIYTAGIPAEYGRKLGGVIEVNTLRDAKAGLHGEVVVSGGSFGTAAAFAKADYLRGSNLFGGSASGSITDHYLNPVVPQNYSNTGTLGDFSGNYQRNLTPDDRLGLSVRHELSRYDIPNEQVQQGAGQRQTAGNIETLGLVSYEHTFSAHTLADVRGMVRDNANDFNSNTASTPIQIFQQNRFREGYFKATMTAARGRNEWKFGVESDTTFLHEKLNYLITDPSQFNDGTPTTFSFADKRPDLEQSAFVEDRIKLGNWTIGTGLRWDHYQLLVNKQGFGPRLSVSRYLPSAGLVLHVSYDRVFQTPSSENILLSSSRAIESLDPGNFLRLPVQPSQGDFYEVGASKVILGKMNVSTNYFRRSVDNYADDDQIANTTISFPIAFRKSIIYGLEGSIDVPDWHGFSGLLSYSYTVGNAWLPVTGGLFLGDEATAAASQRTGHFPDSQDQRNTFRGRVRYQANPRLWLAIGVQFDSGLPFDFDGDPSTVLAQYGQQVLDRINFDRGRIYPSTQITASAGAEIYKSEHLTSRIQADGENLNNVLDVIDFGGLFSGNAIGPSRSFALRLTTSF